MVMRRFVAVLVLVVAAALPASAAVANPGVGNSGYDQYTEGVPGPGGDTPSHAVGNGHGNQGSAGGSGGGAVGGTGGGSGGGTPSGGAGATGGGGGSIPPAVQSQISASGPDGPALAGFVAGTAPKTALQGQNGNAPGADAGGSGNSSSTASGTGEGSGGDPSGVGKLLSYLVSGSQDGGGMGAALPILLIAGLLGAGLIVAGRIRSRRAKKV
jgi:hypothetical protein